jgi:GNAT superfamily N-acetyltransferase
MNLIETLNRRKANYKKARLLRHIARIFWVEKLHFYTMDLRCWQPPAAQHMRLNATFSLGDETDVAHLASDPHMNAMQSSEEYLRKLRGGDRLLLGKHDGDIVFYLWVACKQKKLMDKVMPLQENQVAIESGFTRKEYRGHGFFAFGINFLFPQLKADGVRSCITEIATHNRPMIRTALKIGFKETDYFYYWVKTPLKHYALPSINDLSRLSRLLIDAATT